MRLHSIVIDADASPAGYVAWYNHFTDTGKIRILKPASRNERFGVQRMEMLAIYFALADNLMHIRKAIKRSRKKRILVTVRSDSKSTVEQLQGISQIRDALMCRISSVITKLLGSVRYTITFHHLERSRNIAGLLLEQKSREKEIMVDELVTCSPPLVIILGAENSVAKNAAYLASDHFLIH